MTNDTSRWHSPCERSIIMDSINQNQEEENRADLSDQAAVKKIKELVEIAGTCFFCTRVATGESGGSRPMSVREVDEEGRLWFLSAVDSHKNQEISADPRVSLFFQGSKHSDFLVLHGRASISTDKGIIRDLWSPFIKTWFTEGIDDPRITAIAVTPEGGYYWDTKHGNTVAGLKVMVGAMIGKTLDDSIEGEIRP